jgi:hypothetical protein
LFLLHGVFFYFIKLYQLSSLKWAYHLLLKEYDRKCIWQLSRRANKKNEMFNLFFLFCGLYTWDQIGHIVCNFLLIVLSVPQSDSSSLQGQQQFAFKLITFDKDHFIIVSVLKCMCRRHFKCTIYSHQFWKIKFSSLSCLSS